MQSYRENPDGEANRQATREARQAEFAAVMAGFHEADTMAQKEMIQRAQWIVRQQQLDDIQFDQEAAWVASITRKDV